MVHRGREHMMFLSPEQSLQSSLDSRGILMQCPEALLSPESSYEATKAVMTPQGSSATLTARPMSAVAATVVKSNATYRPASAHPSAQVQCANERIAPSTVIERALAPIRHRC